MTTNTIGANGIETDSREASADVLKIKQVIVDKLGVDASVLVNKAAFADDLGVDSLDVFELIIELEREFDITIPTEEAEKLLTVGSVISYIMTHKKI